MKKNYFIILCFISQLIFAQTHINREAVVKRHNIHVTKADSLSSLTVGNGQFAFTVDVTGLQSFPEYYAKGVPLGAQSEWGWHSFPNKNHYRFDETLKTYELEGRKIPYPVQIKEPERNKNAVEYFRVNPHRLQLGNIGLEIKLKNGSRATINDIKNINQELDLWTGIITSSFTVENIPVKVTTVCHQQQDAVAFKIESSLLKEKRLNIRARFCYPTGEFKDVGDNWRDDEKHQSILSKRIGAATIRHILDSTIYYATLRGFFANIVEYRKHYFLLQPTGDYESFEFTCLFSNKSWYNPISFSQTISNSIALWKKFWLSGGAIDFTGSTDPRAFELERRVILSQYLLKVQEASEFPAQETGLTYNSWYHPAL